ncbi:MAG TPA: UDP-N-acetylmuramoyl-L-alanyl-D-glutamate--2,6-diaminopimelate ligase [Clostridiales bacterium]|nr:UDP-N-acetylmuramoyl-L-alanyl-D-glutamate--2,6-diaminopimelate ligase [Clostridiales bacterium]
MRLSELLEGLETEAVTGDLAVPISGITYDSRAVRPGSVFFCVRGFTHDGHDFIPEAVGRGATALVVEGSEGLEAARRVLGPAPGGAAGRETGEPSPVVVVVPDTRLAMGLAAANFYGHPSRRLRVIGVTGTNGKTTTSHLVRELLAASGRSCGLIGTVHNVVGGKVLPAGRTTPEAFDLQNLAEQMVRAGDTHLSMEVASHGLALQRVTGFEFDVGVFTNLSPDHLDFHGDLEAYFQAKAKLFTGLGSSYLGRPKDGPKAAVLNADSPVSPRLAAMTKVPVVTYGTGAEPADLAATDIALEPDRALFTVTVREGLGAGFEHVEGFQARVNLSLTGRYNVSNALAALAVALIEGVEPSMAVSALSEVKGAPGRFELVDAGQDFVAVVDYAHTPDGLENVLEAARALRPRRVITVFGCGGDRDRAKRPLMGEVAARLSDFCVVTSDNPRSEDPLAIIEEIRPGLERAGRRMGVDFIEEPDRRRAIAAAVRAARPGDLVLVAGKGHETYQIFGDRTVPFDDRDVLREAIAEAAGRSGPEDRGGGAGGRR